MGVYLKKDICIVIPTYHRAEDLEKGILSLIQNDNIPGNLMIMDQSKDLKTKEMVSRYKKKYPWISYTHCKIPSSSISENQAIEIAKKKFRLILTTSDDVEFLEGFLDGIVWEFNNDSQVMGVGAVAIEPKPADYGSLKRTLKRDILRFFLLPCEEIDQFRIRGPYGQASPTYIADTIRDCQWLSGVVMCYKREVYDTYKMPERIGYNVLEDIDCSYWVYRKYGKGSLVTSSRAKVIHHYSTVARYPDKKRIFVNHEDHLTFYYTHFHDFPGTMKLLWELFWISFLNVGRFVIRPKKENRLKLAYLWQALAYCYKHRREICAGKSRMFLNPDLTLKQEYM